MSRRVFAVMAAATIFASGVACRSALAEPPSAAASVGGANKALQFGARGELGRGGAGVMINFFFHHRAVHIVGAKAKGDLRDAGS